MKDNGDIQFGGNGGMVEIDETYIGVDKAVWLVGGNPNSRI